VSTVVSKRPMTTEELLALPEDGFDRELIRGQLREKPRPGEIAGTVELKRGLLSIFRTGLTLSPNHVG
jgi:hypothetical protein